jgi:hypothetical protein
MQLSDVSHPVWRKSTRSNGAGGDCVEVADLVVGIGVRDSKAPHAGHLAFALEAWAAFVADVKAGRHDE